MDVRAEKMRSSFRLLGVFRIVFLVASLTFAAVALVVGVMQAADQRDPTPAAYGIAVAAIATLAGGMMWFIIGRFMRSATEGLVSLFGPQFEQDLTGEVKYWQGAAGAPASPPTGVQFDIQAGAAIVVDGNEQELLLSAANLFTKDDLRGNIDVIITGEAARDVDRLIRRLSEGLKLRPPGRKMLLSCVAHGEHDEGLDFAIVFGYSVSDLIEEFAFDRPQLEAWLDDLASERPMIDVLWDGEAVCMIPCHVAD